MEKITRKEVVQMLICTSKRHKLLVTKEVMDTGLSQSQHRLLMYLFHHECVAQTEIAKAMQITTATVAVALKKLEKSGYIAKAINESDNRYNQIVITEKGRELVEKSKSIFDTIDEKVLKGFSPEELQQVYGYLARMSENLKKEC